MSQRPLRVLLIAEAANPEWVSVPLIGWSLSQAIARITNAHLVTQLRNRKAVLRAGLVEERDFTAIDSERFARPMHRIADLVRGGKGVGWTSATALSVVSHYYFEHLIWKRFGDAIRRREFDLVHRITPLSPTSPSMLARRCELARTPFVLGPLNGGVPWPRQFDSARRREREWLSYVRSAYKLMPGYRSTLASSAAIIAGSRSTLGEIPQRLHGKCFYIPENGIDPARFSSSAQEAAPKSPLRACFVGRLVPYKGPDMLIEAIAPLARAGELQLDVYGDGPMMPELQRLVEQNQLGTSVTLHGWVAHTELQSRMGAAQLLLFPSIREFGGGVVLEAMALGTVPVVIDYAGPGELVTEATGFRIPLGTRSTIVSRLRETVAEICRHPARLGPMSSAGRERVQTLFTWEAKARQMMEIYEWVLKRREQRPPDFSL
jgi:glycogen synthase